MIFNSQSSPLKYIHRISSQQGFSLVEFMITSVIALFLVLGMSQIFLASRSGYSVAQAKARMQEGARIGLETLQRDIRMAGYMGCVNDGARLRNLEIFVRLPGAANFRNFTGVAFQNNFARATEGFEATNTGPGQSLTLGTGTGEWTPALPAVLRGLPVVGSDVMVVRYLGPERARLVDFVPNVGGATVQVDTTMTGPIVAGRTYALSNCNQVSFFVANNVNAVGNRFVASGVSGAEFFSPATSYLYEVTRAAYYVGEEPNTNTVGLFRYMLDENVPAPTEAIVPNVASLQLMYGWDTQLPLPDGAINVLGTGATLSTAVVGTQTAYSRVGQVRVGLLMTENTNSRRASESSNLNTTPETILGAQLTPPNQEQDRLAEVYEITASPRNHLFGY